jgi:hypothetical protein
MLVILLFLKAVLGPFHNPADMWLAYQDLLAENEAPFKAKPLDLNEFMWIVATYKDLSPRMKDPYEIEYCLNEAQCFYLLKRKTCQSGDLPQYSYNWPARGWSLYCIGLKGEDKADPPPDKG